MLGCRSGGGSSPLQAASAERPSASAGPPSGPSARDPSRHDRIDDLLDVPFDALKIALRGTEAGALLHSQPVHLPRELAAELLEEVLAHQLVLKRAEHPLLDFRSRDRQLVCARAAVASAETSELLARIDDEAGTAFAALREAREQVLRPAELVEAPAFLGRLPLALNARVSRLYRLPDFIVDDPQLRARLW